MATALALTFSCSNAAEDAGANQADAVGGAQATIPGNEAIPDIGKLSRGGARSTTVGSNQSGGSIGVGGIAQGGPVAGGTRTVEGSSLAADTLGGTAGVVGRTTSNPTSAGVPSGGESSSRASTGGARSGGSNAGGSNAGGSNAGGSNAGGSNAGGSNAGGTIGYHTLTNWISPAGGSHQHHGLDYFIGNAQKDEQGLACTSCHGANLEGTSTAPACASCHANWRGCTFCHGTSPSQNNPPRGIASETTTSSLAVGRHVAHLTAGNSHAAFACSTCHVVPAANNVNHVLGYVPSTDLSIPGHHGDVTFSGGATGMTWNVNATSGNPVTARGTCSGGCHSNGRGGNPVKTPNWAGGTWTNACTNCHGATGATRNSEHGHGFPGSTCADCHSGATATSYSSANHMNGIRDIRTAPGGAATGMRLTNNWSCSSVPCH